VEQVRCPDEPGTGLLHADPREDRLLHGLNLAGESDERDRGVADTRSLEPQVVPVSPNPEREEPILRPVHAGEAVDGQIAQLAYGPDHRLSVRGARGRSAHVAPRPLSTAGTVFSRISRSSASDQCSMYSRSSSSHLENGSSLRPEICQRQVRPGFTLKRLRWMP